MQRERPNQTQLHELVHRLSPGPASGYNKRNLHIRWRGHKQKLSPWMSAFILIMSSTLYSMSSRAGMFIVAQPCHLLVIYTYYQSIWKNTSARALISRQRLASESSNPLCFFSRGRCVSSWPPRQSALSSSLIELLLELVRAHKCVCVCVLAWLCVGFGLGVWQHSLPSPSEESSSRLGEKRMQIKKDTLLLQLDHARAIRVVR